MADEYRDKVRGNDEVTFIGAVEGIRTAWTQLQREKCDFNVLMVYGTLADAVKLLRAAQGRISLWKNAMLGPDEAVGRLMAGNRRYALLRARRPNQTGRRRVEVAAGQHPFAIVLGCADSRVPPEVVFHTGLGELFVVRAAGHVADHSVLASLEYAAEHLSRIKQDTYIGMLYSNGIALCIVLATAVTLNLHGITDIQTSGQAAEAPDALGEQALGQHRDRPAAAVVGERAGQRAAGLHIILGRQAEVARQIQITAEAGVDRVLDGVGQEEADRAAVRHMHARTLLISFTSDWLYPPSGSIALADALRAEDRDVTLEIIDAPYGHDCFLLEEARQTPLIQRFLAEDR